MLTDPLSRRPSATTALMLGEAATLAVFATLHLTGALEVGPGSRNSDGAGLAEAVICAALLAGAGALARGTAHGRRAALLAVGFAIVGFIVGLSFTISGGDGIDLAYHALMLPILMGTAILLIPDRREGTGPGGTRPREGGRPRGGTAAGRW